MVYNVFKSLLNEQMKERIFFHGDNMESLHQHVEPKHLPERYGGIHPDHDYRKWLRYFKSNEVITRELGSLGYLFKEENNKIGEF